MRGDTDYVVVPERGDTNYVVVPRGGGMRGDTDYVVVPERGDTNYVVEHLFMLSRLQESPFYPCLFETVHDLITTVIEQSSYDGNWAKYSNPVSCLS